MRRRWIVAALLLAGCSDRKKPPPPAPPPQAVTPATESALCKQVVRAVALPLKEQHIGPGKWSVQLDVEGKVLAVHGARFMRRQITPNGEAWAGLFEQCVPAATLHGVHLDPEAGSLHAWIESDGDKDRFVAALCRAVDDGDWLDRCIDGLDRARLDD